MEGKVHHLQKCLDGIYKVIRSANDILCGISQPSVCSEVLQSPQGVAYISGVNEVYKVAKRVEGGMKSLNIDNQNLHNRLRDIELTWNNLQAFFSFSPTILQMLSSELTPVCSPATDSENGPIRTCGVCLFRTGNELNWKMPATCLKFKRVGMEVSGVAITREMVLGKLKGLKVDVPWTTWTATYGSERGQGKYSALQQLSLSRQLC
ncbi:synergin gamma-like isoform X3 [Leucoraja erinacea]|nr:synergin gamma-like isoform X3 [Leucoraja erinacea]XP_055511535.1 synergin gamma-like isoform X3 [Leucoraja erinacea]